MLGLLTFKEDPKKVEGQFREYIKNLKDSASTPKQKAIANQIGEKIKLIYDKYADNYNKNNNLKKFNS